MPPAAAPLPSVAVDPAHASFLYGRITTIEGDTYEGRLRWGGSQEAFWGDYFNGAKKDNPWAAQVPPERLPKERRSFAIFGIELNNREYPVDLGRLFMARFGDLARIEARGRDVRVVLKSGAVVDLDRFGASDFDDGVQVWDDRQGATNLDSLRIRTIEFLPAPSPGAAPHRLHGTVRTQHGSYTGFLQWSQEQCIGSDEFHGYDGNRETRLRFVDIGAIERRPDGSSLVKLQDGREIALSGTRDSGEGSRGVYIDDPRYGRVLVSWNAFEAVNFSPGGGGPAYGDYPPGGPIRGTITTRDGRRLAGRLVFDLDESEVTDTLDAPLHGVTYTIPFGLIASIALPRPEDPAACRASLTLHSGEELRLECTGDLGERNAGMLVFLEGNLRPEYVPWQEIAQLAFDRPQAMYPPLGASSPSRPHPRHQVGAGKGE